ALHACDSEVSSACPDRPGSEMAKCLKDKKEHETATTISSECADFMALNAACAEDITKFCDDAFFSDDTALCLSEWTPQRNLSPKCASVVEWAIPKKEDQSDGPTDELGMSEKDYREKQEWQAKRKEGRGAAIEKIREDKNKEREMEALKKEDPDAYREVLREQEEAKRSYEEFRKRNRLLQAAEDRERRAESGEKEDHEETEDEKKQRKREARLERAREAKRAKEGNWLPYVLGGLFAAYIIFNVLNYFGVGSKKDDTEEATSSRRGREYVLQEDKDD
ncbi:unnamed protein product, partial [Polarella glacialis]